MKFILEHYLEYVLVGIATFLLLVVVAMYIWGMTSLLGVVNRATAIAPQTERALEPDLEGAQAIFDRRN